MSADFSHAIELTAKKNIAIVGGGIASVCLAHQLFVIQPELNITIYCQDNDLGSQGSSNKQGAIYPLLQGSQSKLASLYSQCYQFAKPYYQSLIDSGVEFEHQWCGVLQQAHNETLVERYQKVAKVWPQDCEFINAEQADNIAGIKTGFASLYFSEGGWLYPQQLTRNLALYLQQQFKLTIKTATPIDHIEYLENAWSLVSNNSYKADVVVIANSYNANQFVSSRTLPLTPVQGQVSQLNTNTPLNALTSVLCHKGYVTPSQGNYQCFGATFNKGETSTQISEHQSQQNLEQLKKSYQKQIWSSALNKNQIIGNNSAIRATSSDHLPFVGEYYDDEWVAKHFNANTGKVKKEFNGLSITNDKPGCYLFTGFGARGLTSIPLLAKQLAQTILAPNTQPQPQLNALTAPIRLQLSYLKRNKSMS